MNIYADYTTYDLQNAYEAITTAQNALVEYTNIQKQLLTDEFQGRVAADKRPGWYTAFSGKYLLLTRTYQHKDYTECVQCTIQGCRIKYIKIYMQNRLRALIRFDDNVYRLYKHLDYIYNNLYDIVYAENKKQYHGFRVVKRFNL